MFQVEKVLVKLIKDTIISIFKSVYYYVGIPKGTRL